MNFHHLVVKIYVSTPGVILGLRNRKCSPALPGSQTVPKPGMTPGVDDTGGMKLWYGL
jgi:hypothetical protein